jgi:hypothetical protein
VRWSWAEEIGSTTGRCSTSSRGHKQVASVIMGERMSSSSELAGPELLQSVLQLVSLSWGGRPRSSLCSSSTCAFERSESSTSDVESLFWGEWSAGVRVNGRVVSSVEDGSAVVENACPGASCMSVMLCAFIVASGMAKLLTQHKLWGAWMM